MRGKEEDQFAKSKDNYEKMQKLICEGSRFNFRFDLSTRIVPRDVRPEVEKRFVEIPIENTQNQSLPEPKKRRAAKGKKKPPKKFHMPDGVETGFKKLSYYMKPGPGPEQTKTRRNPELDDLEEIPDLNKVSLTGEELKELDRSFRELPFSHSVVEETDMPSMTAHPVLQRQLRPVVKLKHGTHTRRFVKLLARMGTQAESLVRQCRSIDTSRYEEIPVRSFVDTDPESEADDASDSRTNKRSASRGSVGPNDGKMAPPNKRRKKMPTTSVIEAPEPEYDEEARETQAGPARKPKRIRSKRKGNRAKHSGGINSDEVGDDCERDSDLLESSGSDDGADLLDFVVADNQATSSMLDSQATSPTTTPPQSTPEANPKKKPFYVPTHFSATQESDDMPDLDTLGKHVNGRTKPRGPPASSPDLGAKQRARGRRQVFDTDSDS
jgi:ATP-dependent DNA helicase MPH1